MNDPTNTIRELEAELARVRESLNQANLIIGDTAPKAARAEAAEAALARVAAEKDEAMAVIDKALGLIETASSQRGTTSG